MNDTYNGDMEYCVPDEKEIPMKEVSCKYVGENESGAEMVICSASLSCKNFNCPHKVKHMMYIGVCNHLRNCNGEVNPEKQAEGKVEKADTWISDNVRSLMVQNTLFECTKGDEGLSIDMCVEEMEKLISQEINRAVREERERIDGIKIEILKRIEELPSHQDMFDYKGIPTKPETPFLTVPKNAVISIVSTVCKNAEKLK